jgi:hypothetical protein
MSTVELVGTDLGKHSVHLHGQDTRHPSLISIPKTEVTIDFVTAGGGGLANSQIGTNLI